ncbi:hypothetical protein EPUL_004870, partial [Erysiphe pulchra]
MSRHRIRSFSNSTLHRSNSNTSSSTTVTKSLLNSPSSNVPASSAMAAAAAAAALRSRPASPVSVADVKTKRMLRRKSSASSNSDSGVASRELQALRRSSSGSMLQRSFRESSSIWSRVPINIPPVPPLPDDISRKIPESSEESITREAFQTPKLPRQTSSLDNNRLMGSASRPKTSYNRKSSSIPSAGRMSINFSLPTDSRPNSPVTQRRFISPLTANLTSSVSSSTSNPVYDVNSTKLIPDSELSVTKKVIDTSEKSLAKKDSLTQSQIRRASLPTEKFPGNSSKNAKATKNSMKGTNRTSSLPVKYPFMTKPSFFSSTIKALPSKLENTDDQACTDNNNDKNNNDFQYLKPLEFENFPSNFSIDRDQFNHFDHENSIPNPTTIVEILDNQCSTNLIPEAEKILLSPLLIHPAELSDSQALDSKIFSNDLNFEKENHSVHNHDSKRCDGGISIDFDQNSDVIEKYYPKPPSHFSMNPKNSAAINYLTHSTNHPCKSALKFTASSSNFGGSEDVNKFSTDESHSKRKVSRVSFDQNPSIVERKSSVAFNPSPVIESQNIRDLSNPDSEKTKDVSFSMRINEIIKPRPRLPSFGTMRSKKRLEEIEERHLTRPLEAINYTLSPVSPVSPLTLNTYPSLEIPENEKNNKTNSITISNQVKDENLDNAANVQISKNQLHNHIESPKDYSLASNDFSVAIKNLQSIKSTENLTTLTCEQMCEKSNLTSKNSSKILTANTSESYLTFLESPTNSLHSHSPNNLITPSSATLNMKFERLHVPGAWDSSNEDVDRSPKLAVKLDVGIDKPDCQTENQSSVNVINTNYTHKANTDSSQVPGTSEKDSISHKTTENLKIEEDSETGSIYCDAVENIVIAENSNYSSFNAISTNSAVYEDEYDGRLRATTEKSSDRHHFAKPMKSDASRSKRLTGLIVGKLPHRQISDRVTIQPVRKTENYRSLSLTPKSSSEPAVEENFTRSVSKEEVHSQEVKVILPGISMRRGESRESLSSFKRARPIVRESHLRSSMRESIRPKANKFRLSDLSSSRYETSSPSLTQSCNLRAASKFRFSKIRNRHTLGLPIDGKIIKKTTNCLFDYNDSRDFNHSIHKIRFTNSSSDNIINNPKWQSSEVSLLSPKTPSFQKHLGDYLDIWPDNYHQFNELSDPSKIFESNKTAGSVSSISTENNKVNSSTRNFYNQTPIKPKENLISMIRRMKADVNDKVRKQDKEKVMTPSTTQDLQNLTFCISKNQDNSFNSPNHDSEQSPSWPLPTSDSNNTQIT